MDFETLLRKHIQRGEGGLGPNAVPWINQENRVVLTVKTPDGDFEYVVVGDRALPYPIEVPKPPTQVAKAEGFDAHKGMGER